MLEYFPRFEYHKPQKSSETKKPVRVIRGFKSTSKYAPTEGYRYDGLYVVEKVTCPALLLGDILTLYLGLDGEGVESKRIGHSHCAEERAVTIFSSPALIFSLRGKVLDF